MRSLMAPWWWRGRSGHLPARPLPTRSTLLAPAAHAVLLALVCLLPAALAAQQGSPPASVPAPSLNGPTPAASPPGWLRQQADERFLAERGAGWHAGNWGTSAGESSGNSPAARLANARAAHLRLLRQAASQAGDAASLTPNGTTTPAINPAPGTWQPLGPMQATTAAYGAVTGRITSLAADPNDSTGNTLYLGSTGGGVWKSITAAGAAGNVVFTPLTDTLAAFSNTLGSLSIGAVTVQPVSSSVILAGTGDTNSALDSYYGVGILRSADGGSTWTLIGGSRDVTNGGLQNYSFTGNGFSGFAWSSVNTSLVVAAVGQSYESTIVNAGSNQNVEAGLYYSSDAGQTWYLGIIEDDSTHIVQSPNRAGSPPGNAATSVVWNPVRQRFYAAVRYHGYYESPDGITWTRLANQPSPNLARANCPTNPGGTGQTSCPIYRGALAVQPVTGDMFALTTDGQNLDQGLFQDVCSTSGIAVSSCASSTVAFANQLPSAALEAGNGDTTIPQADYDLTLAAVASQQDTILFAGTADIFRCSLANSCAWRNTTNTQTCAAARVAPSQHATEATFGGKGLVYFANDGGLWRSTDTVAQTGSVCAASDASHYQNLNGGIGSLAEVSHFAVSPSAGTTLLAGLGGFGTVATSTAQGPWQQLLTGDASYTAIDRANPQNWYTSAGRGLAIHRCTAGTSCNAAGFGATAVVGSAQVQNDANYFVEPAPWMLDPLNSANLLVGTCRVWRGPATGGSGWSSANLLSPILDGNQQPFCNGNSTLRSLGGGTNSLGAAGSERMYAGMAGPRDGGSIDAGHVFTSVVAQGGGVSTWTDLYHATVTNSSNQPQFNQGGWAISSIAVDSHDTTGQTVYVTIQGFSGNGYSQGEVYGSVDAGAHWLNLTNSLPLAPANSIVVDPNVATTLYVALDTGVYYTQNIAACADPNQTCWAVYGSGLPNAPVTELHIYSAGAASTLEAATYGRGIWSLGLITASTQGTLTPTSYTFPAEPVGTPSSAATFTLTNTGSSALAISQVALTGDYAQTNSCGSSVAVGVSCTILVTFTPTAAGDRPGTLTVYANVAGGSLVATLDGSGIAPGALSVSPASLSFPSTTTGTSSAAQTVTVQNTGGASVTLQTATVSTGYQLTANSCGATLAAGASCTLQVAFAPTTASDQPGSLTIPSNLPSSPVIVSLDGTGIAPPALTLSPTSLSFPATAVGSVSGSQTITVTSSGGSAVQLQAPALTGDYQLASTTCGAALAPGANCTVQIAFAPTATGSRPGLLTIQANVSGGQVTAALSGSGLAPAALVFAPTSLSFPSTTVGVTAAAQSITLTNSGGAPAQLQSATVTGDYAIASTTCAASLAANASCTLQLTFTPTAAGDRPGLLTVPANVSGGKATAALDGTGLSPAALTLAPASLTFAAQAQGTSSSPQTIMVTNSGGSMAQLQAASVTGDFAIASNSCGATLAAGANCSVAITFTPTATGARSGVLTIPANITGGQATAQLNGTGVAPAALTLSPASLSFAAQGQGTTSAAQAITVTSSGGVSVQLQTPAISGDFQIAGNSCGSTLAPGASCAIGVTFTPSAVGARTGTLTLPANVSGGSVTASLTGSGVAPAALTLTPASLSFPATTKGVTSAALSIQLKSSGGVAVQLQTPSVSGDYAISASTCGATLAPAATCTVQITFTPTATGDRPGQLTVPASVSGGQVTAPLDGTGLSPASLTATPASLTFASTAVGATSAAQGITVSNVGGSPAQLQTATITGDFAITTNTCAGSLAASSTCSIQVTFTPSATGARTGLLTLPTNAPGGAITAALSGTGVAPAAVTLSPSPVGFGSVVEGSASAATAITVTSTGGVAVQLGSPSLTGDYQISGTTCGTSLAPSGTCAIQVVFHPNATGDRPGLLTLPGSMTGGQATDALDGSGLAPGALSLAPTSLTFATLVVGSTSTAQSVVVTNGGGASVTLQAATVTGDYAISSNTCGAALAAGASCTIGITFQPAAAGDRHGQLQVPGSVTGGKVVASLDGTGALPASLAISPAPISFGQVVQGTTSAPTTLSVTNSGGVTAHLQSTTITGDFAIANNGCGSSIGPGAGCSLQITFTPSALGSRAGLLSIASDAAGSPATDALSGTGVAAAKVMLTPTSVSFPSTVLGSRSAASTVTATNSGGVSATLGAGSVTGDYQLTSSTCGTTLAAGASCTLQVVFAPTAAGDRPGALSLPGQFSGSPATAALDGTGLTQGTLVLTPTSLSFGSLLVGATSTQQTVTVSNGGGASVTLQTATVSGDYEIAANSCGATLAGGGSCTIQVVFHPTATGDRPGQLRVPGSVSGGAVVASLDGAGLAAASLAFSPTSVSFGGVVVGTSSAPSTLTVTNSGGVLAHLQSTTTSGDFAVSANTCASTLAAGATCSMQVTFTPTATGSRTGVLTLTSDAPNSPASATVSGTGLAPGTVVLSPGTLAFAQTVVGATSAAKPVIATNSGGVAVQLGTPVLTGDYTLAANGCASTLAAGASCTLQVSFTPTAAGDRPGTLSLPGQFSASPATIPLDGTGLLPGSLTLTPSSLNFGSVITGTVSAAQTVTASNPGGVAVQLGSITVSSGYAVKTSTCTSSVAPGASCSLQLVFQPTSTGERSGLLTIVANIAGGQATAALDGTGIAPGALGISPTALSFPATAVGAGSTGQMLTVNNTGGAALALGTPAIAGDYQLASNSCGSGSLGPGASCVLSIVFRPTQAGDRPGSVTLSAGSGAGQQVTATLDGQGLNPAHLGFTPASLAFGSVQVGKSSSSQAVTLANTGDVTAQLALPVVTGDYSIASSTCGSSLAGGASCAFQLLFSPTASGDRPGSLAASSVGGATTASVALDGAGTLPPSLILTPTSLTFAATGQGTTTAAQNVTVANVGSKSVQLQAAAIQGDFQLTSDNCSGRSIDPNFSCTLSVTFTPAAAGQRTGLLTVADAAESHTVTLAGTGLASATDTLSPTSLTFGTQVVGTVSAAQAVTLANTGGATLSSIGTQVVGPFTATNNCGTQLGGGLTCSIAVAYVPSSAGQETGQLIVTDALRSQTVALAGQGALPPRAIATPNSLSFGGYALGGVSPAQSVTFTNNGATTITGLAAATGNPNFVVASNTCGDTLDPGTSCAVGVAFAPQGIGNQTGQLTFTSPSLNGPMTVSLSGSGEDFQIAVSGQTSQIVTTGQSAIYQVVATPTGSSAGALTMGCTGAPTNTTCTVNPVTVNIAGGTTGSATVTIATGVGKTTATSMFPARRFPWWPAGAAMALVLPVLTLRGRARRSFLLLPAACALVLAPTACGVHASGGSSSTGTTPPGSGSTPPGTYQVTITANFPGAQRTAVVTLIVQ